MASGANWIAPSGVGDATEALEGFTDGADIGEIDADVHRAMEAWITGELEQQLVGIHPAAAAVSHLDGHIAALDAVSGLLLTLAGRCLADGCHHIDQQGIADGRQPGDVMGLDHGTGAATHHQPEGIPVDEVGGGAVVGPGDILRPVDPGSATDPEPATGGESLLLTLQTAHQGQLVSLEPAEAAQTVQVAGDDLGPALPTPGLAAAVGAVEDRVGGRGSGREVQARTCSEAGAAAVRTAAGVQVFVNAAVALGLARRGLQIHSRPWGDRGKHSLAVYPAISDSGIAWASRVCG